MIDVALARALVTAGLRWQPTNGDWFCLFDEGESWLIAPGAIEIGQMDSAPVLMFHGASEWALDTVWAGEALWLPNASQLQLILMQFLGAQGTITLDVTAAGSRCRVRVADWLHEASAVNVEDAYGAVLLAVMQNVRG
ncbi:MAG: hypothetical protein NT020_01155 [Chloroflexales bacterium]|nr:hypothetical protein [Chloroflexales bacterium]